MFSSLSRVDTSAVTPPVRKRARTLSSSSKRRPVISGSSDQMTSPSSFHTFTCLIDPWAIVSRRVSSRGPATAPATAASRSWASLIAQSSAIRSPTTTAPMARPSRVTTLRPTKRSRAVRVTEPPSRGGRSAGLTQQPPALGDRDRLQLRVGIELAEQGADVAPTGVPGDAEPVRDGGGVVALGEQVEHLVLARGQHHRAGARRAPHGEQPTQQGGVHVELVRTR